MDYTKQMSLHNVGGMNRFEFTPLPDNMPTPWDDQTPDEGAYLDALTMPNLKAFLDAHIVGQEQAKKMLAQVLYMTFEHRLPATALMIGPTGSGKTECARAIAAEFPKVCHWCNCATLTPEGYKGDMKLSTVIRGIKDDGRMHILFADEFDKIVSNRSEESFYLRQDEWLKLADHDEGAFPPGCVRPENLTIICMGAFQEAYEAKEKNKKKGIGFSAESDTAGDGSEDRIGPDDLIKMGFRPELIGRFTHWCQFDPPTIEIYEQLSRMELDKLSERLEKPIYFPAEELRHIAAEALESGLGARKIRAEIRRRVEDYIYDHPYDVTVDLLTSDSCLAM